MPTRDHQADLRRAYVGGGPGAIVSGVIWLAAGLTETYSSTANGFYVLFFAGMFIFPISKLVLGLFFKRPAESKSNPGGLIVMETVFPMIGGLFGAWLLLPYRPEYVFPLSAIAVGAHYFGFRTAYGDWTYWVFGGMLCAIGTFSILSGIPQSSLVPYSVSVVEILFGAWLIAFNLRAQAGTN